MTAAVKPIVSPVFTSPVLYRDALGGGWRCFPRLLHTHRIVGYKPLYACDEVINGVLGIPEGEGRCRLEVYDTRVPGSFPFAVSTDVDGDLCVVLTFNTEEDYFTDRHFPYDELQKDLEQLEQERRYWVKAITL